MSNQQNSNGQSQNPPQQQQAPQAAPEQNANRPEQVLRDGAIKATIWRNDSQNGAYFNVDFAKTYEDRNGNLKDTRSFSGTDLLRLSELSRQAYTVTADLRRAEFKDQRRSQQNQGPGLSQDH